MADTKSLRYTKDHEWVRMEGDRAVVGITDYAQSALGDLVFIDLPTQEAEVAAGDAVAEVESTKTVSSIIAPLSGKIVEVHDEVGGNPDWINSDPYGEGWLFAMQPSNPDDWAALMDEAAYQAYVEEIS